MVKNNLKNPIQGVTSMEDNMYYMESVVYNIQLKGFFQIERSC